MFKIIKGIELVLQLIEVKGLAVEIQFLPVEYFLCRIHTHRKIEPPPMNNRIIRLQERVHKKSYVLYETLYK